MSIKNICQKELNIKINNSLPFTNKCQHYIDDYFTKLTKSKKYHRRCLTKLEFINKQKISYNLWFLNLQCKNNHHIMKKLFFSKNKWWITNIKN